MIQSGLRRVGQAFNARGIVVRGVVIATYFADEENRPGPTGSAAGGNIPKMVTCDVLTYGSRYRFFLPRVPVAQMRHALNDHDLWKPRATTVDLSTGKAPLLPTFGSVTDAETLGDPRDFDGDHVLIEFLEGDTQQAFIRTDMLPHPRSTFRQERARGDRRRSRHRGVIQEIDDKGNYTLDATRANDGTPDPDNDGAETPAVTNGSISDGDKGAYGNVTIKASNKSELNLLGVNDSDADEQFRLRLKANELLIQLVNDVSLLMTGNDANTNLTVGDGAVSVAIAETLESLWGNQASYLDAHVHPETSLRSFLATAGASISTAGADPTLLSLAPLAAAALATAGTALTSAGSSLPDAPSTTAPSWNPAINSTKVTIPDG